MFFFSIWHEKKAGNSLLWSTRHTSTCKCSLFSCCCYFIYTVPVLAGGLAIRAPLPKISTTYQSILQTNFNADRQAAQDIIWKPSAILHVASGILGCVVQAIKCRVIMKPCGGYFQTEPCFSGSLLLFGSGAWHVDVQSYLSTSIRLRSINASCNIDLHGTSSVHVSISVSTMFISFPVVKPLISVIQLVELSNFLPNDASEHLVGQSIFLSQHATTHLTEHFV